MTLIRISALAALTLATFGCRDDHLVMGSGDRDSGASDSPAQIADSAGGGAGGAGGAVMNGGALGAGGAVDAGGAIATGGIVATGGVAAGGGAVTAGGALAGGAIPTGGVIPAGGVVATGGSIAMGGAVGTGGAAVKAGASGSVGLDGGAQSCTFAIDATLSPKIKTVGIVTWTSDLPAMRSAHVEFGADTAYGMTAPVDLTAADHRTLLLGMKQSKTYHYRIVGMSDAGECASADHTLTTGSLGVALPQIAVATKDSSRLYGGFLVTGQSVTPAGGPPAYIADADGELVWAYPSTKDVTGIHMSYDGKSVWLNSANVPKGQASVHRVSMDGLTDEDLSAMLPGLHHNLAVLPDETVAFAAYDSTNNCDDIREYSPKTGTSKVLVNAGKALGGASQCHVSDIQYSREDDTLVFSEQDSQTVAKIRRTDGSTVWLLNGPNSTFTGAGWKGSQAGMHVLGTNKLLVFNNNSKSGVGASAGGTGDGSIALEISLDLAAKKATQAWAYKANPSIQNDVLGDVQRLANGNTLVGYATQGVLHEVGADGVLLQEWTWGLLAMFGNLEKRATLYGPPPR